MSINRREFLQSCAAVAAGIPLCARSTHAVELPPASEVGAVKQSFRAQMGFDLVPNGEPDAALTHWGTSAFGGRREFATSKMMPDRKGIGIFPARLDYLPPIVVVATEGEVRPKVEELLKSGEIHIDRTPIATWE